MDVLTSQEQISAAPPAEPAQPEQQSRRDRRIAREGQSGGAVGVAEVLGQQASVPGPSRLSLALTSTLQWIKRAVKAVLQPRVAGILIGGLGVLIVLLLAYVYVFTPLS